MELILNLNGEEVLLFCSRIKNSDIDFNSGNMIAPKLLLKLFSVFNELVTEQGFKSTEMPVSMTEQELWLLRSYVQPSDKIGNDPLLGIKLMRKIHALLLDANCDIKMIDLEDEFKEWAKKQPKKEVQDAKPESDQNSAENDSGDPTPEEVGTGKDLSRPETESSPKD